VSIFCWCLFSCTNVFSFASASIISILHLMQKNKEIVKKTRVHTFVLVKNKKEEQNKARCLKI